MTSLPPAPQVPAEVPAGQLEIWEEDGGVRAIVIDAAATTSSPIEPGALLERLGAALLAEWHTLPTSVQKAVYEHAVAGPAGDRLDAAKRQVALLLHEHMGRRHDAGD